MALSSVGCSGAPETDESTTVAQESLGVSLVSSHHKVFETRVNAALGRALAGPKRAELLGLMQASVKSSLVNYRVIAMVGRRHVLAVPVAMGTVLRHPAVIAELESALATDSAFQTAIEKMFVETTGSMLSAEEAAKFKEIMDRFKAMYGTVADSREALSFVDLGLEYLAGEMDAVNAMLEKLAALCAAQATDILPAIIAGVLAGTAAGLYLNWDVYGPFLKGSGSSSKLGGATKCVPVINWPAGIAFSQAHGSTTLFEYGTSVDVERFDAAATSWEATSTAAYSATSNNFALRVF